MGQSLSTPLNSEGCNDQYFDTRIRHNCSIIHHVLASTIMNDEPVQPPEDNNNDDDEIENSYPSHLDFSKHTIYDQNLQKLDEKGIDICCFWLI